MQPHEQDGTRLSRREALGRLGLGVAGLPLLTSLQGGVDLPAVGRPAQDPEPTPTRQGIVRRVLGRTGIEVPVIAIGTVNLRAANARVAEAGFEQGLIFIDTASGYGAGQSEIAIGKILASRGKRDQLVIATKASGFPHGRMKDAKDEEVEKAFRSALEKSLANLQTDYVDIYFPQHGQSDPTLVDYPQLWRAMEKFKEEGKIRAVALSTHTDFAAVSDAAIACGKYDVLMTIVNAATMDPEVAAKAAEAGEQQGRRRRRRMRVVSDMRDVVRSCQEKKIGLIAMKAANPSFFPGATWQAAVTAYGADLELSDHQVLYRKVLLDPVASVNVGMDRMSYLEEALAIQGAAGKAKAG